MTDESLSEEDSKRINNSLEDEGHNDLSHESGNESDLGHDDVTEEHEDVTEHDDVTEEHENVTEHDDVTEEHDDASEEHEDTTNEHDKEKHEEITEQNADDHEEHPNVTDEDHLSAEMSASDTESVPVNEHHEEQAHEQLDEQASEEMSIQESPPEAISPNLNDTAENTAQKEIISPDNAIVAATDGSPLADTTPKLENNDFSKDDEKVDTIFDDEQNQRNSLAEINFEIADTGRWLLKVIGGPNNGAEFSMRNGDSYVIGTDPNSCDIIFHDTSVSRQQARITVSSDDTMTIEDLKSRNGTLLDGEKIKSKTTLPPNAVVTLGTTAFTVYDREGEMQTIISPLLPDIVKSLKQEEPKPVAAPVPVTPVVDLQAEEEARRAQEIEKAANEAKANDKIANSMSAFIVIGILTGLFVIVGLGTATLFKSAPIKVQQEVDGTAQLNDALAPYPRIKHFYNKNTGVLQLTGDVLTLTDKNQILYTLQGLSFIKDIDTTGLIIDEFAWQEINQGLAKNPNWKGVSIYANTPGKFILTGNLQTRKQAAELSEYLNANFIYLDKLEKRIVVEEDLINSVTTTLQNAGLREVAAQISNNEVTLTGSVSVKKKEQLAVAIEDIKKIEGVKGVKNFISEVAAGDAVVNISDRYNVTGFSRHGSSFSVVIQGLILTKGDELDGMKIIEIRPNTIRLEKDNVQYRIDFGR